MRQSALRLRPSFDVDCLIRIELDHVLTLSVQVADEARTSSTVSVNLDSIWTQAEHALPKPGQRGHNDAYTEAQRMAGELDELLEQARLALDAGDGETALDVLEVITEVLVTNRWSGLLPYDVPERYETIGDLSDLFIEAVLTADLDESERQAWEPHLREWDGDTVGSSRLCLL